MDSENWSVLASEVVFDDVLTIVRDRLRKPDGEEMDYRYISANGASAVLAFTEDERVVLTRQYRHPLRQTVFDLPAGGIRPGEDPRDAALRELAVATDGVSRPG